MGRPQRTSTSAVCSSEYNTIVKLGPWHRWVSSELRCYLFMFCGTRGYRDRSGTVWSRANGSPAEDVYLSRMLFRVQYNRKTWTLAPLGVLGVALLSIYVLRHAWLSG